ncbi:MAG: hypothetical protein KC619_35210 [Myxococcales bacterium]|nr:hypothetical protein [Myxococcales bacterium]
METKHNARVVSWMAMLAIGIGGCTTQSHTLLGESDDMVFTDCDALEAGEQLDRCDFNWGAGCQAVNLPETADYQTMHSVSCASGELIVSDVVIAEPPVAVATCEGAFVSAINGTRFDVVPAGVGCVSVTYCGEVRTPPRAGSLGRWQAEICQATPRPGRGDGDAAWTECEGVIEGARDGEPCAGELRCAGLRENEYGFASEYIAWCDAGVLRFVDAAATLLGGSAPDA